MAMFSLSVLALTFCTKINLDQIQSKLMIRYKGVIVLERWSHTYSKLSKVFLSEIVQLS